LNENLIKLKAAFYSR